MRKLKAKKKKEFEVDTVYIVKVASTNIPNPYLLPLTDPFAFDFSFLILPDIISDNIPVPFL